MSFLLMGSGWVSIAGLAADITGAMILAWDILPEYRFSRWRRELEAHTGDADRIPEGTTLIASASRAEVEAEEEQLRAGRPGDREVADEVGPLASASAEFRANEKLLRQLMWTHLRWQLQDLAEQLQVTVTDPDKVQDFLGDLTFSRAKTTPLLMAIDRALDQRERRLSARPRPPLRLAIALVVAGFVLQAWGTIPVS